MKSCPLTPHRELLFSTECIFLKTKQNKNKKIPFAFFMENAKKSLNYQSLEHLFSTWGDFAPYSRGHLAIPEVIFGCHN